MNDVEYEKAKREDFDFFVLCHSKGNPAMYEMLRDKRLDEPRVKPEDDIEHNG